MNNFRRLFLFLLPSALAAGAMAAKPLDQALSL